MFEGMKVVDQIPYPYKSTKLIKVEIFYTDYRIGL